MREGSKEQEDHQCDPIKQRISLPCNARLSVQSTLPWSARYAKGTDEMKRDGKKNVFGRQWEVERLWEAKSRVWLRIQNPSHPLGPVIIKLSNLCIPVQE